MDGRDKKSRDSFDSASIENRMKQHSSRRGFMRGALLSTVAIAATTSLAKKASTLIPEPDHEEAARRELLAGNKVLKKREYVVMTGKEKREYLAALLKNHKKGSES
ncbi:MAG: hypothetical protein ACE5GF_09925 [Thermodesulfobacteriota bacterium]